MAYKRFAVSNLSKAAARSKISKLDRLASDPGATAGERETAARQARRLREKYGMSTALARHTGGGGKKKPRRKKAKKAGKKRAKKAGKKRAKKTTKKKAGKKKAGKSTRTPAQRAAFKKMLAARKKKAKKGSSIARRSKKRAAARRAPVKRQGHSLAHALDLLTDELCAPGSGLGRSGGRKRKPKKAAKKRGKKKAARTAAAPRKAPARSAAAKKAARARAAKKAARSRAAKKAAASRKLGWTKKGGKCKKGPSKKAVSSAARKLAKGETGQPGRTVAYQRWCSQVKRNFFNLKQDLA